MGGPADLPLRTMVDLTLPSDEEAAPVTGLLPRAISGFITRPSIVTWWAPPGRTCPHSSARRPGARRARTNGWGNERAAGFVAPILHPGRPMAAE